MTTKIRLFLLLPVFALACSPQREVGNSPNETEADFQPPSAADQPAMATPNCPEVRADPQQPSVVGVRIGATVQEAESALNCAGYRVDFRRRNHIFQGGQTGWTSEIVGSKNENGNQDIVQAFIVDLDGPDDPRVFGIVRQMGFRSNMPTFEEFNSRLNAAYARNGSVGAADLSYSGGVWYVEYNGQPIDQNNSAFGPCKPLVQSSQEGCGYSQGYYLERFRGNPDLVISAQVAIHDRGRERAELARLNQRITADQNAAAEAARSAGQANIPDL